MRILVSGASGFVGAPLCSYLRSQGNEVVSLVRSVTSDPRALLWDPEKKKADNLSFNGFDAVIHLAGDPLTFARWSLEKKARILQSRVDGTSFLCTLLSSVPSPPKVFISASAVGIYGDRGEETLDEESLPGEGFLAEVCKRWESASHLLKDRGVRVATTRFGIVLGSGGGALARMLPIYRWGLGSILGTGRQWMSWIFLSDLVAALAHVLVSKLEGPINFVSPHSVRQETFSRSLAHALHRPHFGKIPSWALRALLGEVADALILSSAHVLPVKLLSSGFAFQCPRLEDALQKAVK